MFTLMPQHIHVVIRIIILIAAMVLLGRYYKYIIIDHLIEYIVWFNLKCILTYYYFIF